MHYVDVLAFEIMAGDILETGRKVARVQTKIENSRRTATIIEMVNGQTMTVHPSTQFRVRFNPEIDAY